MHTLGSELSHQRYDRDEYININFTSADRASGKPLAQVKRRYANSHSLRPIVVVARRLFDENRTRLDNKPKALQLATQYNTILLLYTVLLRTLSYFTARSTSRSRILKVTN